MALLADIKKLRPKEKPLKPLLIKLKEMVELSSKPAVSSAEEKSDASEAASTPPSTYIRVSSCSDTHMQHRSLKVPKCDILVISGDFTNEGTVEEAKDVNDWLGSIKEEGLFEYAVLCPGNHEGYGELSELKLLKKTMTNATVLHDESLVLKGLKFYGTGWTPNMYEKVTSHPGSDSHGFLKDNGDLTSLLSEIPKDTSFLICHSPPQGILDSGGKGSAPLRIALQSLPLLKVVQFGHVHSGRGYSLITRVSLNEDVTVAEEERLKWLAQQKEDDPRIEEVFGLGRLRPRNELINDDPLGDKLVQFKIPELRKLLKSEDDGSSAMDPAKDLVLFMNATNDRGGTERNPIQPSQPFYFDLPM